MSRLRLILGAGACSIALSGCLPAAAGLALSAAQLVAGGGAESGNAFRNPIDKQSTGRQVREALSRLNDQVDPACQAMLDERQKAGADTQETPTAGNPQDAPRDLMAKLDAQDGPQTAPMVAENVAVESAVVEAAGPDESVAGSAEVRLATAGPASAAGSAAPGQCEHRLVCLPGTPKPTLMLMCPGKGGGGEGGSTTIAGDRKAVPQGDEGALVESAATAPERSETPAASVTPDPVQASTPAPARGVADWNWAYDPSKQL